MKAKLVRYIRVTLLCNLVVLLTFAVPTLTYADTPSTDASVVTPTTDPTPSSTDTSSDTQPVAPSPSPDVPTPPVSDTQPTAPTPSTDTSTPTTTDTSASPDVTPTTSPSDPTTTDTNTVQNAVDSAAQSGNATVDANTTAGNATSGDAADQATIINAINSTLSTNSQPTSATFVSNINGDVNGDVNLSPEIMDALGRQTAVTMNSNSPASVNLTVNTGVTNNVNLTATSGSASVLNNTTAGDATTGNADAVANVINIMNSVIGTNKSFVGVINIYGNLDGNILVAPDFISQLLASNSPSIDPTSNTLSSATIDDSQTIANNLNLSALSGNANLMNNTTAGNATSGDAATNIDILNLSGHQVLASDSLLVFVNVLGKWVGVIIDAPTGSTAAAFDGGATAQDTVLPNLVANDVSNVQLTNNITLAATSGDATIANNTTAGNATTGNATASANIANITQTVFSLGNWFGVIFINVFGSWLGSFGVSAAPQTPDDPTNAAVAPLIDITAGPTTGFPAHSHKAFVTVTSSGNLAAVPVTTTTNTIPSDPPSIFSGPISLRPLGTKQSNNQGWYALIILGSLAVGYGTFISSRFGIRKAFH